MTQPEEAMEPLSANINMTADKWNRAVKATRYPAYRYDETAYQYGGNLDAYRKTWAGYTLGSIDAYGSKYTQYRDIRSTYMRLDVTSPAISTNTWYTASSYNYLSNSYNATNQEGRLSLDTVSGLITPNVNSAYILWAEIKISSIPSNTTAAFLQIRTGSTTVADINQNLDLTYSAQSFRLRNQTIVAYKNTAYTIRYKFLYTGSPPNFSISFGYTELVGEKNNCGAYSIL